MLACHHENGILPSGGGTGPERSAISPKIEECGGEIGDPHPDSITIEHKDPLL